MNFKEHSFMTKPTAKPETTNEIIKRFQSVSDIPVKYAVLAWNSREDGHGEVVILPHDPENKLFCGAWYKVFNLKSGFGAYFTSIWKNKSKKQRCHMLLAEAWRIVIDEKMDPKAVNSALMVIPEMRKIIGPKANWPYLG